MSKLIKNLSIRAKITLGYTIVMFLGSIAIFLGAFNVVTLSQQYTHLLENQSVRAQGILEVDTNVIQIRRIINMVAFRTGDNQFIPGLEAEFESYYQRLTQQIQALRQNMQDDHRADPLVSAHYITQLNSLQGYITRYRTEIALPTIAAAGAGNLNDVMHFGGMAGQMINPITEITSDLVALSRERMDDISNDLTSQSQGALAGMLVVIVAALILAVLSAYIITKSISGPIRKIVGIFDAVASGKFNVNIIADSKDEIGTLSNSAKNIVETIRTLSDDMSDLREIYRIQGDRSHRINTDKYENSFKDMATNINQLFDDESEASNEAMGLLQQIIDGNFEMTIDDLPGDWKTESDGFNQLLNKLRHVQHEINMVVNAAAFKGDLAYHVDASAFSGAWHQILTGINEICEAVDAPVVEIRDVLAILNKGHFNAQIKGSYSGDFLQMKEALNFFISDTMAYISEINTVLLEISKGNLTRDIKMDFIGDYASIKSSVNTIVKTLNNTMAEISHASDQVAVAADQVSASSGDLAEGSARQASSIEELHEAIGVLNMQTTQNVDSASSANALSAKSTDNALAGNDSMKQMTEAMSKIKESSNDISKIVKTIQDIAFQTNLLALNASVEAARAGEHGRGFAVVAEEVRTLANRSQIAATETTALITDSINRVDTGNSIADSTSVSLEVIVESAQEVLNIINNISEASLEQASAIRLISDGINEIAAIVQTSTAATEEAAATSHELSAQASALTHLVSFFKLS